MSALETAWSLYREGDYASAMAEAEKLLAGDKEDVQACHLLGLALMRLGDPAAAIAPLESSARQQPYNADILRELATALRLTGRLHAASQCYEQALVASPENPDILNELGYTLKLQGRYDMATERLEQAVQLDPQHMEAYRNLGNTLMEAGKLEASAQAFGTILAREPDNLAALCGMAELFERQGKHEAAYRVIAPLIDSGALHIGVAIVFLKVCTRSGTCNTAIQYAKKVLESGRTTRQTAEHLLFELGKLYDRQGDYDTAFSCYQQGNRLRDNRYEAARFERQFDDLISSFSKAFMTHAPRADNRSTRPLFIVGMPRSGTSLTEQILACHPDIHGAGELPLVVNMVGTLPGLSGPDASFAHMARQLTRESINRLAQQYLEHIDRLDPAAKRVTDKMPQNFMYLGLISLMFPGARIIHCMRDPRDTCLSIYFQRLADSHAYASNLENIGHFYRLYERLMKHYLAVIDIPVLEVRYEDLVTDQEAVTRKLVEFTGLDWDPRCLEFHKSGRFVATCSYEQVQRPMFTSSIGRWQHYRRHLAPLLHALQQQANTADAAVDAESARIQLRMGLDLKNQGQFGTALAAFRKALEFNPGFNEAHTELTDLLLQHSHFRELAAACQRALAYAPEDAELQCKLAVALEQTHHLDSARAAAEQALNLDPKHARAQLTLAKIDKRSGDLPAARKRLEKLQYARLTPPQQAAVLGELGDVYDRMGEYTMAFYSFHASNQSMLRMVNPAAINPNAIFDKINHYQQSFTDALMRNWPREEPEDGIVSPIFLVGFPRSGTTLTEQIISAAGGVTPTDEEEILTQLISDIPKILGRSLTYPEELGSLSQNELTKLRRHYWSLAKEMVESDIGSNRLLDKLPLNLIELGLVQRLFPCARVVVVLRDPRDSVLSCFMRGFVPNEAMINLTTLEQSAKFYAAVMGYWLYLREFLQQPWMEIRYEDIVTDFDNSVGSLINFLGLEWSDAVRNYHLHAGKRDVRTPSYSDISQPIFNRAIGRWRNYAGPLSTTRNTLQPFIRAFGYNDENDTTPKT